MKPYIGRSALMKLRLCMRQRSKLKKGSISFGGYRTNQFEELKPQKRKIRLSSAIYLTVTVKMEKNLYCTWYNMVMYFRSVLVLSSYIQVLWGVDLPMSLVLILLIRARIYRNLQYVVIGIFVFNSLFRLSSF